MVGKPILVLSLSLSQAEQLFAGLLLRHESDELAYLADPFSLLLTS